MISSNRFVGGGLPDPASNARKILVPIANNTCLTKLVNCVKLSLIDILKEKCHVCSRKRTVAGRQQAGCREVPLLFYTMWQLPLVCVSIQF
jgi:hypothetical protein